MTANQNYLKIYGFIFQICKNCEFDKNKQKNLLFRDFPGLHCAPKAQNDHFFLLKTAVIRAAEILKYDQMGIKNVASVRSDQILSQNFPKRHAHMRTS